MWRPLFPSVGFSFSRRCTCALNGPPSGVRVGLTGYRTMGATCLPHHRTPPYAAILARPLTSHTHRPTPWPLLLPTSLPRKCPSLGPPTVHSPFLLPVPPLNNKLSYCPPWITVTPLKRFFAPNSVTNMPEKFDSQVRSRAARRKQNQHEQQLCRHNASPCHVVRKFPSAQGSA